MDIRYRRKDGTQEPIAHAGQLRSLVDAGEIGPDTPMYDQYRGAWCAASLHPMAKTLFARESEPFRPPTPPLPAAHRPSVRKEPSPSDSRVLTNVLAGTAAAILILGILLLLGLSDTTLRIVLGLRTFCMLVAMGTLSATGIIGMRHALQGKSHRFLTGMLSLIPLAAFGLFLVMLLLPFVMGTGGGADGDPPAEQETTASAESRPAAKPGAPKAGTAPQIIENPSGSMRKTVERIIGSSLATLEKEQAAFVKSLRSQHLDSTFRSLNPGSSKSIRDARKKVQFVSELFEAHPRKVKLFYDDVILRIEQSGLDPAIKADLAEAFRGERDLALPELAAFFHSMRQHYDDIDRMLSFMEGIASHREISRQPMSEGDRLTLELYQGRLDEASERLEAMEKDLEVKLTRIGTDTLDRIAEVME